MATDTDLVKGTQAAIIASTLLSQTATTTPVNPAQANVQAAAEIRKQRTRTYVLPKAAADAMASTATSQVSSTQQTVAQGRVYAAYLTLTAALTVDATNNATVNLLAIPAAGGSAVTVASVTTNVATGNFVADVRKPMTLTAANVDLADGQTFALSIAKGGSGVIVPIGFITVLVEDT